MDELQELKNRIEAAAQEYEAQFPLTAKMLRGLITGETVPNTEEAKHIKDSLDFTGEEFIKLIDLADRETCDGHCDEKPPYRPCAECEAINAINDASEILRTAMHRINKHRS